MDLDSVKQKELDEFFERGVNKFIDPDNLFRKKLEDKIKGKNTKQIIVKFGVDPTRPDIHLGHAVVFRKLRRLQDWGCKVVFLVGDFTAQIGDPTGRDKVRPEMEQKEIEINLKTYLDQLGKILRTDKDVFSWIRNSDWFTSITDLSLPDDYKVNLQIKQNGKELNLNIPPNSFVGKAVVFEKSRMQITSLGLKDKVRVITLVSFLWNLKQISFSRLIERDMFQERIKKGQELRMHEMMYPVLQGIDSQVMFQVYGGCDLEVGGSDQLFNMLVGRDIMKFNKTPQQGVLAFDLLTGTDGKEKMSKSLDNYIGITEKPDQIFGKIMSIPDSSITDYFYLCTYTPFKEVEDLKKQLVDKKVNPRDLKFRLAKEIVAIYHGEKVANEAEINFLNIFQKKQAPAELPPVKVPKNSLLHELLISQNIVDSKAEFKRLISEGAISDVLKKKKITSLDFAISENSIFKIGKKRFVSFEII